MHNQHYKQIREFISSNFLYGEAFSLKDDASFLESGIVDSTGMLELIMFLEHSFNLKVEPDEMIPVNLDSVSQVAQFIARKQAKPAGA